MFTDVPLGKAIGQAAQEIAALRRRLEMVTRHIDAADEDKLAGDLPVDEWREKDSRWRAEREDLKAQIDALDTRKDDYIDRGVELIELTQRFEKIYKAASPEKKRRIVEIVSSNLTITNGRLEWWR
jgi:hypothetical protein